MVLNNDTLGEVKCEQREPGNPEYGCEPGHIDFAAVAEAAGARGFRAAHLNELRPAIQAWLAAPGCAVLDVRVDAEEKANKPEDLKV
jgi:thiamine pyrophosphate-dependent acetolactate synthase large subunit-like protein